MGNRNKSICNNPVCNELIDSPGYCIKHSPVSIKRANWNRLDAKKTPEQRRFYNTNRWRKKSINHLINEPLCRKCKTKYKITVATLTHHHPELQYLLDNNLDPYDDKYLESSCGACHLGELRSRKGKEKNNLNSGVGIDAVLKTMGGGG